MINVFGWKTVKTKEIPAPSIMCESCKKIGTIKIQYYQQYSHAFFIPTIPMGRSGEAICTSCRHSISNNFMNSIYKKAYKKLKPAIPLWTFIGLILLVGCISFNMYEKHQEQQIRTASVTDCHNNVTSGKIYQIGINGYKIDVNSIGEHDNSTLIKIKSVKNNTVEYYENLMVRKNDEKMIETNAINNFKSITKTISIKDFNKLEILYCR